MSVYEEELELPVTDLLPELGRSLADDPAVVERVAEYLFQEIVGVFEGESIGDPEQWPYSEWAAGVWRAAETEEDSK